MSAVVAALLALWSPAAAEPGSRPRVAVVLDDFGLTYRRNPPDEEWMALDFPLTFAVMPESPRTKAAAAAAKAAGKELIIHYPFDPFQRLELSTGAVSPADVESVSRLLEKSLRQIPGAVGLNNHRSYRATRNRPLMAAFMRRLKPTGLYFLDSGVSPRSVAYEEARSAGIPAARDVVFLDTAEVHTRPFCARMLARAVAHARRTGAAVAIGHHYFRGTLDCLKAEIPRYQKEGVEFVTASALVR
ncbi:MAG: divergent polysaccharide deacetylase family protein [Elusimicrobia bacterium]|nr:divergent polysaccharide deacetylase family protein [Elusimicrobiota bacterium]